jgi:hypothetical protein
MSPVLRLIPCVDHAALRTSAAAATLALIFEVDRPLATAIGSGVIGEAHFLRRPTRLYGWTPWPLCEPRAYRKDSYAA